MSSEKISEEIKLIERQLDLESLRGFYDLMRTKKINIF